MVLLHSWFTRPLQFLALDAQNFPLLTFPRFEIASALSTHAIHDFLMNLIALCH